MTLFVPYLVSEGEVANRAVVYFHGNGEELGDIRESLSHMSRELRCNVFAAEYPGYGVNKGQKGQVFSGVDIHEVVKDQAAALYSCEEHFPNGENIKESKARLMGVHGERDEIISVRNSHAIREVLRILRRFTKTFWARMTGFSVSPKT